MSDIIPDLIQVLWVEDDPVLTKTLPAKAEDFGLQLSSFSYWDEAKEVLKNDFDRWSAIILDAKCKYHRESEDNAVVFLRESLKDISVKCEEKGRLIPWYILSGGAETEILDSINDDRLKWDADWKKKYYSKASDTDTLFRRIKKHAKKSPRLQIKEMYRNVFDAIRECGLDNNGRDSLVDLLVPIHFPKEIEDKDYNDKYAKARTILECIFRSMSSNGILPEWGKQVNLRWSCCLLSGIDACGKNKKVVMIRSKREIIPAVFKETLRTMVEIIPPFCHSDSKREKDVKKYEYFDLVDNSTLLLKSFTFQICELILWYRNYLKTHRNKEENMLAWEITSNYRTE